MTRDEILDIWFAWLVFAAIAAIIVTIVLAWAWPKIWSATLRGVGTIEDAARDRSWIGRGLSLVRRFNRRWDPLFKLAALGVVVLAFWCMYLNGRIDDQDAAIEALKYRVQLLEYDQRR
jgi:hypothetical protein